ncbi:Maf family protein [Bacillaceae bacterium S4-13-56]
MNELVLASTSPRRKDLLFQLGYSFSIRPSHADESLDEGILPMDAAILLAKRKGEECPFHSNHEVIISADTVVALNQKILGKPSTPMEALEMLQFLNGQTHEVITGVRIASVCDEVLFSETTKVTFWELTDDEVNRYVTTGDPYDKAGGYGIQSHGAFLVKQIEGDYNNVVGLPISRLVRELEKFGIHPATW